MNDENARKLEEDARDLMMRIQASETAAAHDIAQMEAGGAEDIDILRWRRWRRHFDETSDMRARYQAIIKELASYTGPEPSAGVDPQRPPGGAKGADDLEPHEKLPQPSR
jgi:hypothetical protein